MKVRIKWQELSTYEQVIELPDGTDLDDYMENEVSGDGEGMWFAEVDTQNRNWFKDGLVEVSEREVIDYALAD